MGFLKKLKETAEKGIEKSVELGTKGYDSAKDAASRGTEKARGGNISQSSIPTESKPQLVETTPPPIENKEIEQEVDSQSIDPEALMILKMRLAKGEISKEEFEEMKDSLK